MLQKDKCELCALMVVFDQDVARGGAENTENLIELLRKMQREGLVDGGYNRRTFWSNTGDGDKSQMCALNSKFFLPKNKGRKCPDFILNMGLKVPEALALNVSKRTDRLTSDIHKMTLLILFLTVLAVVVAFVSLLSSYIKATPLD